jgi:hypothetical protein
MRKQTVTDILRVLRRDADQQVQRLTRFDEGRAHAYRVALALLDPKAPEAKELEGAI